jgi:argininosuccinate lyase
MDKVEQPASKMWSGRFREPLDPGFEQWQRSFPFDWQLFEAEISASGAHARTLAAAGILDPSEEETILHGLREISKQRAGRIEGIDIPDSKSIENLTSAQQAEDVHHFIELELTRIIGPIALKLHTGRSRNEQIATDMRIYVLDCIDINTRLLNRWMESLLEQAESAGTAVMPSYTHLQRAEPVLVAHWLLAYVSMIERDRSRLLDCRKRTNVCPLGSGAVAGATLPLDRSIAARFLYMDGSTSNSIDATSDRDFLLEFVQTASILGVHISRFAEELTLFATAEFGFVDLPEAFSTGSSAMPQKKNPDLTELARGKAARLIGAATALVTLMKGLPLAYNKDLQEGQEQVFDVAETITGLLQILPAFTGALKFNFARMRAAATTGYLNAMAAATYLSNKGVAFRKAHEIVGNAVRLGLETGRELNALTLEELRTLSDAFAEDFFESITLEATLDCHDVVGGTNRARVASALAAAKRKLGDNI